jgi:hypothetical protein
LRAQPLWPLARGATDLAAVLGERVGHPLQLKF